jgi:hypothetical protein
MGNPTKIDLSHAETVTQDSQRVRLCNVKMPAQNFAQNERSFLQHGADGFAHVIGMGLSDLGSSHIEILPSAKRLGESFTVRKANRSASYSNSSSVAIAQAKTPLSMKD